MGRAGRSGEPSVCIFLHRQGERLPKEMRPFFKGGRTVCLRKALTEIFTLSDQLTMMVSGKQGYLLIFTIVSSEV